MSAAQRIALLKAASLKVARARSASAKSASAAIAVRPDRDAAQLSRATSALRARRARDMLPGRIETARLVLRAPIRGDVPDLVRLADNKAIAAWLPSLPSPYTRADAIAFVEIFAQRADERPYAITRDGQLIGVVGFSFHAGEAPALGYWLGEQFWGQGLMSEAVAALIEAAQVSGDYEIIAARAFASNIASQRVLEKAGFRRKKTKQRRGGAADEAIIGFVLERPRWM